MVAMWSKLPLFRRFQLTGWIAFALLTFLGSSAQSAQNQSPEDFLFLFLNPSLKENRFTSSTQIRLAEEAGITKFSFAATGLPGGPVRDSNDWNRSDDLAELFVNSSPVAMIAPRIPLMTNVGKTGLKPATVYRSGPSKLLCWTDPSVQDAAAEFVRSTVSHYESSPWANQIWGYHITARETGEWIPEYRSNGVDYSPANTAAFRKWLADKYGSDRNLQIAWGKENLSLSTVEVPIDDEGRFPLASKPPKERITAFYALPQEQNWVDYSTFVSDDNAKCIRRLAKTAKEACSGQKAVLIFYGYIFDLPGSICGHLRAREILRDDFIDYVAAPVSYEPYSQRLEGGVGAPMSAVDSVPLHGKTWINEDDLHTHAQMEGVKVPDWYWDAKSPEFRIPSDVGTTEGILRRNLAFVAFHHAATWWMDLYGGGWFSDPELWKIWSGDFGKEMATIRKAALPYRPDVAVIIDEESRFYEKFAASGFQQIYPMARNSLQGCGASVGFYYLDDYLEGLVPPSPATVFINAWHLDTERLKKLQSRIAERKGTVIWQYAPGYMNPEDGGSLAVERMTGIKVKADKGNSGSLGTRLLGNAKFGGGYFLDPRIIITDRKAMALGIYVSDSAVSAATKTRDGVRHILIADTNWSPEFLSALFQAVKIPVVTSSPAVVQVSNSAIYLYGTREGTVHVNAPSETAFSDGSRRKTISLKINESQLLFLAPKQAP